MSTPITDAANAINAVANPRIVAFAKLVAAKLEPPPPPPPPPPAGKWAKGGYGLLSWATIPAAVSQYDVVIAADWQIARLSQLGSAATLYTCGSGTRKTGDGWNGVTTEELLAAGWQLKDSSGAPIINKGYAHITMADVGNTAYQAKWASNVAAYCHAHGVVRIELDDVDTTLSHDCGVPVPAYPNGAGWKEAHTSFVHAVTPVLSSVGISTYPNVADGATTAQFALSLKPAAGVMLEDFGNVYGAQVAKDILTGGMDVLALAYTPTVGKEQLLRTVDNGRAVYMVAA